MAPDREVLSARLASLEEYLRILEPLATIDVSDFVRDPRLYGSAERFLHLSLEAIFDIGTHCLAALGLRRPSTYGEILPALAEAGIIRASTAESLAGIAGFRNLLVHDYARIDRARVHAFVATRLASIRSFGADIAAYLDTLE